MKKSITTITAKDLYDAAFDQYFDISYIEDEVNIESTVEYIKAYAENAYDETDIEVNNLTDEVAKKIAKVFLNSGEDADITYQDYMKLYEDLGCYDI